LAFFQFRPAAFLTAVSTLVGDAVSTLVDDAVSTLVDDVPALVDDAVPALVDGISALGDGLSAGADSAPGTIISGSGLARASSSLSDFAVSFGANANSILLGSGLLRFGVGPATEEVGGAATLIAITGPRPTRQNRVSHIVLGNQVFDKEISDNQSSCRVAAHGS
jgi:hypothetical protein